MSQKDFFSSYLQYTSGGEVPVSFNRWAAIAGIGALLERNIWLEHGHSNFYPNIYCMLIGDAGTRKSAAIVLMKRLLVQSGYKTIAAERTSKEKYLADLGAHANSDEDLLDTNIFGEDSETKITPSFIMADEANDFFGINNIDFLSVLGSLWSWEGKYENKIKTGKSDWIPNPTISILSGNTSTNFSRAFPPEILEQGFFSRLLLIYGERTGIKIAWPTRPPVEATAEIVRLLQIIKHQSIGERKCTPSARNILEAIYLAKPGIQDPRFASYYNRRHTHLLKLCLIVSAAKLEETINERTVIQTNTYLSYAERLMPKALGSFGRAKSSDVTHKILTIIQESDKPLTVLDVWASVSSDLDGLKALGEIVRNLLAAGKIQSTAAGLLPVRSEFDLDLEESSGLVSYTEFLTPEELRVKK